MLCNAFCRACCPQPISNVDSIIHCLFMIKALDLHVNILSKRTQCVLDLWYTHQLS